VARRPKLVLRKAERGIELPATDRADTSQLHHLSDFLAWGTITIGHIDRAGQVAIAAEGKHVYVMLRRFPSENLDQTLIRLDQALGRVFNELVYIDEVNPISESTVTY
jgi:hypothetical protein